MSKASEGRICLSIEPDLIREIDEFIEAYQKRTGFKISRSELFRAAIRKMIDQG